jgi:glutaredoxin
MTDCCTDHPSQIVVYSVQWCPDCKRTKAFLAENQIFHIEVDIDANPQAAEFVKLLNNGLRSVPTILFPDGTRMVEPSSDELSAKFQ